MCLKSFFYLDGFIWRRTYLFVTANYIGTTLYYKKKHCFVEQRRKTDKKKEMYFEAKAHTIKFMDLVIDRKLNSTKSCMKTLTSNLLAAF